MAEQYPSLFIVFQVHMTYGVVQDSFYQQKQEESR